MAYKRKQISVTDDDFALLEYVKEEGKGNESKFIWNCVRYFKENQGNQVDEQKIIEIIEGYFKNKKIEPKSSPIDRKVVNSMMNILNS